MILSPIDTNTSSVLFCHQDRRQEARPCGFVSVSHCIDIKALKLLSKVFCGVYKLIGFPETGAERHGDTSM